MGEALARNEVLLFAVGLIQRLTFLPPAGGQPLPDPEDYHVGVTRIPNDFHVRIIINELDCKYYRNIPQILSKTQITGLCSLLHNLTPSVSTN